MIETIMVLAGLPAMLGNLVIPVNSYDEGYAQAVREQKPFVVGVASLPPSGAWVSARIDRLPDFPARCVVVSTYQNAHLRWVANLPADATAADVEKAIYDHQALLKNRQARQANPLARTSEVVPKRNESVNELQQKLYDYWPKKVPFPDGLLAYRPTLWTQRIAITNERFSNDWYRLDQHDYFTNAETSFNPNVQFPWSTPGGLHDAVGWESIKAVYLPGKLRVWQERVSVPNSEPLPKTRWAFPDGTLFVDLLVREGKCFELRTREKIDGKWVPRTPYVDTLARPTGYVGAGKACVECHSQAGTSLQYGITVRGDDHCFTFNPFREHGNYIPQVAER